MADRLIRLGIELVTQELAAANRRPGYIRTVRSSIAFFAGYLHVEGIADLRNVDAAVLDRYRAHLASVRSKTSGELIVATTVDARIAAVRLLFRALYRERLILANPARTLAVRRKEKRLRVVFTREEIDAFLDRITPERSSGLRDRALFELLYSSGLRVAEAARLTVGDIDRERRMVRVYGKFDKERIVPISDYAFAFLDRYLAARSRPAPLLPEDRLFVGTKGPIKGTTITERCLDLLHRFGMYRKGLCAHSIRHACAAHLLENGASVRYVQELLGHESVETTVRYTALLVEGTRRVFRRYHPRENEFAYDLDGQAGLDYERRLASLAHPGSPDSASSQPVQAPETSFPEGGS